MALLVIGTSTGCFILDELDGGEAVHAPKQKAAPKANAKGESGDLSRMFENGSEALVGIKGKVKEAMKPAPDPDNTIIRCQVEGRSQYTRKHDCLVIGGIVMR